MGQTKKSCENQMKAFFVILTAKVSQSKKNLTMSAIMWKIKTRIGATLGPLVRVWFRSTIILYHESVSIPWVYGYTMSPCLYHESMYIPWVHVFTMSPFLYHESMYIPWVHVLPMSQCLYHESMSIPWVHIFTMSLYLYHEAMYIPYSPWLLTIQWFHVHAISS